jgi:hypothetical protein
MDNIFANANLNVTPGYTAKKTARVIDVMSDNLAAAQALREMARQETIKENNAAHEAQLAHEEDQKRYEGVLKRSMHESQVFNAVGKFNTECKTYLFKKILTEVYAKSLLIDDDFVQEHFNEVATAVSNYVDDNGGYNLLESAVVRTNSKLLARIKSICEKCAAKVSARKIKETTECGDVQHLNFDLNDEEQNEFDKMKSEISPDEIADLVKDKVLTVVKDEKQRQQNEDELKADIENEIRDDELVVDEETAKESLNRIVGNNNGLEETTLFNALFRHACGEIIIESLSTTTSNSDIDVDTTEDDIIGDSGPDGDENAYQSELDMDAVLSEAIATYTLMEMAYTLKLKDYKPEELRQQAVNLIQPIKK